MNETQQLRLGAYILRPPGAGEAVHRFQVAETNGYHAAYATHVNGHDALTLMGAAAARTSRIQIGVGIVPIYTRTPATMAMSAATLSELSNGRAMLGLGTGHRLVIEPWHGDLMERPLADMREYIGIVRSILAGNPQPRTGKWASNMPLVGVSTAPAMPLMIGALAPAMLRLAGEIADGVMVWLSTPAYIADVVVPMVREGRERAGKSMDGFEIVASVPCAPTNDPQQLRATYVKQIVHNLRLPFYRGLLERGGYDADVAVLDEVERYDQLESPVAPEAMAALAHGRLVADIAAIGDDEAIAATLLDYRTAGVTVAGINPVRIDDFDATIEAGARALAIMNRKVVS